MDDSSSPTPDPPEISENRSRDDSRGKSRCLVSRQTILLLVLFALLSTLLYDRYARRSSELAYEMLVTAADLKRDTNQDTRGRLTDAEVRQTMGDHQPSSTWRGEHVATESYIWRRGRLIDNYFVVVVYFIDIDGQRLLKDVILDRPPMKHELALTPSEATRHHVAMEIALRAERPTAATPTTGPINRPINRQRSAMRPVNASAD